MVRDRWPARPQCVGNGKMHNTDPKTPDSKNTLLAIQQDEKDLEARCLGLAQVTQEELLLMDIYNLP